MKWYELACQLAGIPANVQKTQVKLNKRDRCSVRAIARLHPEIGLLMDELDAPWNLIRKVAHAPGAVETWGRAELLLTQLIEKRAASDPSLAKGAKSRLDRLREAVEPNDPVLRQALAVDAERYKPRPGAVPPRDERRSG